MQSCLPFLLILFLPSFLVAQLRSELGEEWNTETQSWERLHYYYYEYDDLSRPTYFRLDFFVDSADAFAPFVEEYTEYYDDWGSKKVTTYGDPDNSGNLIPFREYEIFYRPDEQPDSSRSQIFFTDINEWYTLSIRSWTYDDNGCETTVFVESPPTPYTDYGATQLEEYPNADCRNDSILTFHVEEPNEPGYLQSAQYLFYHPDSTLELLLFFDQDIPGQVDTFRNVDRFDASGNLIVSYQEEAGINVASETTYEYDNSGNETLARTRFRYMDPPDSPWMLAVEYRRTWENDREIRTEIYNEYIDSLAVWHFVSTNDISYYPDGLVRRTFSENINNITGDQFAYELNYDYFCDGKLRNTLERANSYENPQLIDRYRTTSTYWDPAKCADTGIQEELTIFPNPTDGVFYLSHPALQLAAGNLYIFDARGRTVAEVPVNYRSESVPIDIPNLAGGVYFLLFVSGDLSLSGKLIIRNVP